MVLDGLSRQSYQNFNVIIVIKRANDGTEEMIERYKKGLDIRTILQQKGHVMEALSLGLREATGDFIGFLDDDAIPAPDWLKNHAETYEQLDVAGVAGDVISSKIQDGKPLPLHESEEHPFFYPLSRIGFCAWDKPLPKTEGYFMYITRSGYVAHFGNMAYWRKRRMVRSFLGMGANITVSRSTIKDFTFEDTRILGACWEQILAWHIWKKGFTMVFNPKPKVFHVIHGETLSRALSDRKIAQFQEETELLFYLLVEKEKGLSITHRSISVILRSMLALKKKELPRLRGIARGNIIGFKRYVARAAFLT